MTISIEDIMSQQTSLQAEVVAVRHDVQTLQSIVSEQSKKIDLLAEKVVFLTGQLSVKCPAQDMDILKAYAEIEKSRVKIEQVETENKKGVNFLSTRMWILFGSLSLLLIGAYLTHMIGTK